jgi:hypothetical protein
MAGTLEIEHINKCFLKHNENFNLATSTALLIVLPGLRLEIPRIQKNDSKNAFRQDHHWSSLWTFSTTRLVITEAMDLNSLGAVLCGILERSIPWTWIRSPGTRRNRELINACMALWTSLTTQRRKPLDLEAT